MNLTDRIAAMSREQKKLLAQKMQRQNFDVFQVPLNRREWKDGQAAPLSFEQEPMWILNRMEPLSASYNLINAIEMTGRLDTGILQESIHEIVRRHETLRTRFTQDGNTPIQVVEAHMFPELHVFDLKNLEANEKPRRVKAVIQRELNKGFDLSTGPLLRTCLLELGPTEHIFMVVIHHIVADGISIQLFKIELAAIYHAFVSGNPSPFEPLTVQYRDYTEWQRQWLRGELIDLRALEKQERFWLGQFQGDLPVIDLPADYPRPMVRTSEGYSVHFQFTPEQSLAVKELARAERTTPFSVLLSIYYVFLSKLGGMEDIVIGVPLAGRRQSVLRDMIGMFVKTLAMRNYPEHHKTFHQFLMEVREQNLSAFENQEYPLEKLAGNVLDNRDPARNPLFDCLFELVTLDTSAVNIPGLQLVPYKHEHQTSMFDLALIGVEDGDRYRFAFEYWTRLFKEESIQRFTRYLSRIASVVTADPLIAIADIPILADEEKEKLLEICNFTEVLYPKNETVVSLFQRQVRERPDAVALSGEIEPGGKTADAALTYRQLDIEASRLTRRLIQRGVGPDTIVGLYMERSLELMISLLGIVKAGGAYLPIDPAYPADRVNYMLADSGTPLLVSSKTMDASAYPGIDTVTAADPGTMEPGENSRLNEDLHPHHALYIIYTSGTTGKPKGVILEHRHVVRLMINDRFQFDFSSKDVWTLFHSHGFDFSVWEMYGALLYGGRLQVVSPMCARDTARFRTLLATRCVTVLNQTPSAFYQLTREESRFPAKDLCLNYVIFGGEALNPGKLQPFRDKYPGTALINMFGITETCVHVTFKEIGPVEIENGISNIGKPIPTLSTYITDARHRLRPFGAPGELLVGGSGVARGYLNRPDLTQERFIPNPYNPDERLYCSGDLGRFVPGGDIEYLGRIDSQVKIRGYRIELGEIENRILESCQIKEAVVLSVENDKNLCAYIVPAPGTEESNEETSIRLKEKLADALPAYMVPAYIMTVDNIPLTPNGKINRKVLPKPEAVSSAGYVAPRNNTEKTLVAIMAAVLDLEQDNIGIDHDFFELGGHSLKATQLASRIHKELDIRLALVDIFRSPNVRGLSVLIVKQKRGAAFDAIKPAAPREFYPLSSAQERFFLLHQMERDNVTYNMPMFLQVEGNVDRQRFENAFRQIIQRHDVLRTAFRMVGEQAVQEVRASAPFKLEYFPAFDKSDGDREKIVHAFIRPFNLEEVPLLRCGLISVSEERHILMFDMHHIISDGTSMNILVRDFTRFYSRRELPPLAVTFKDFCVWQQEQIHTPAMDAQRDYWLEIFSHPAPALAMPADFPRPSHQLFAGDAIELYFEKDLTVRLHQLTKETGTTVFMVFLAFYSVLLSKYSHQYDIVIGSPIAGRNHADLQDIMGLLLETIAIRTFPQPQKTFRQFLEEIKTGTIDAFENQDYPFRELVEQVAGETDRSRNPLFDAMLIVLNMGDALNEWRGDDLTLTPYKARAHNVAKVDLTMVVEEVTRDGQPNIRFALEYSSELFKRETMQRFVDSFVQLIETVIEDNRTILKDITIATDLVTATSDIYEDADDFDF